jgi:hypothetical protein
MESSGFFLFFKRFAMWGFLTFVFLVGSFGSETLRASGFSYDRQEKVVDFGILYPIPQLKEGFEKRNRGIGSGVHYNYQFYLNDHIALLIYPNAWFKPLWHTTDRRRKIMLYGINMESGLGFRMLPRSYFDPSVYVTGGVARMKAGDRVDSTYSFPVTGRIGFNLWRQTDPFQDYQLAFHVYGGARHYFKVVDAMKPLMFDVGIAFRGSF